MEPTPSLPQRGLAVLILAAFAGGTALLATVPPKPGSLYPGCPTYLYTGTYCVGCGATRCLHSLLNARLSQALAYNPLLVLMLPLLLWYLGQWWWQLWTGRAWSTHLKSVWGPRVLAGVVIAYWVLRNVPVWPFVLLAPHDL